MPLPSCPYGCDRRMFSPRREGESDLAWWRRDLGREYHNTGNRNRDERCQGFAANEEAYNLDYYGVHPRPTEQLGEKVIVTVELEMDLEYYHRPKMMETLRQDLNSKPYNSPHIPHAIHGGSTSWTLTKTKIKSVKSKGK